MSSVLGGGGSRVKAYMEDTTVPQSAVKSSSPVVLRHAALQMLVELCRFPPPGRLPLSTLVSPELLILHLHQGPPDDGDRVKNLTPPTQDRGLEPGGCPS